MKTYIIISMAISAIMTVAQIAVTPKWRWSKMYSLGLFIAFVGMIASCRFSYSNIYF